MKIVFLGRDMVRLRGTKVYNVPDEEAAKLVRQGKARAIIDPASPPVDKQAKKGGNEPEKPRTKPPSKGEKKLGCYPRVAWIHDTEKFGGAELSNQTVIKAGRKLGFKIYECYPSTFDKQELLRCDYFIINNFFFFEDAQYHFIMDVLFEYKKPFVKYDHDHREVIGDQARPEVARLLFGHSFLNVFISPFHRDNHRKRLGDLIDPCWVLPPAVDTGIFKLLPEVKREEKKMVNVCGKLYESKGFRHMLAFALNTQGKHTFEIYTSNDSEVRAVFRDLKNVKVYSPLPNKNLAEVYNSAGYTIHLPHALEACGRTIAEGLLCGCKPITNQNIGILSFKEFHIGDEKRFNRDKFKEAIDMGPYRFWKTVELHYYGIKP